MEHLPWVRCWKGGVTGWKGPQASADVFWERRAGTRGRPGVGQVPIASERPWVSRRGSRRGSCPPGRLQGEENASRGLSSTPGRSPFLPAVMTSAGLQTAARGWGWLPWLHRSSLPHPPLAPALTWLQLSPQGAAGISPCLAAYGWGFVCRYGGGGGPLTVGWELTLTPASRPQTTAPCQASSWVYPLLPSRAMAHLRPLPSRVSERLGQHPGG